ncbi:MAG: hypothetical protein EOT05_01255 [Candidatus Microsaccharimonas sossegonensis]|uniref:Uncharacterized protein n=1 Tax=Candidatus Microsaccharimonas sossegonensis TaxID=2506948 RepID=A0A4Q0AGT2_9BACT|nr:MAG: hypothetical protein EOT05_01255 [Candidatus Microsaccharimonas sossegonensis]
MQHYIFVKKSQSIQLGHLYEHLIYMSLVDLLSSKKLYKYVDYDLIGKTYHGGLVYIELRAYSKKAKLSKHLLQRFDLDISESRIETAIGQLSAELTKAVNIDGLETIIEPIKELHLKRWYSIDEFSDLDVTNIKSFQLTPPLFLERAIKLSELKVFIQSYGEQTLNRELLPLARQVGKLIAENLTDTLSDTYGLFNTTDKFQLQKQNFSLESTLITSKSSLDLADGYLSITKQLLEAMIHDGAFKRFTTQLRSMSYTRHASASVSFERTYEDTLIFIGSKGWKKIATNKNLKKVLGHTSVEVVFKKTHIILPISTLL